MREHQLTLTESDFRLLMDYYFTNNSVSIHNQNKLYNELRQARVVKKEYLPLNVVSTHSRVLVWNITKGQMFTVYIVPPDEIDGKDNKISVHDPIAIALLGYPSGATTEWEMEDGVITLKIVSVSQLDPQASLQA